MKIHERYLWAFVTILASLTLSSVAQAKVSVVATTTDVAWVVKQIVGDTAKVEVLLTGKEDPHFLDASPKYILKTSHARVVCFNGLGLEVGWLPKVLQKSGNSQVQPGGDGYCDLSQSVEALNVPNQNLDRSQGDVHPFGNPHYSLSPKHLAQAAKTVLQIMVQVAPDHKKVFKTNYETLEKRLKAVEKKVLERINQRFEDKKPTVMQYHQEFTYFFNIYGLKEAGSIEAVPGVPPSASRLAQVSLEAKTKGVALALGALYNPKHVMDRFSQMSGVPSQQVPTYVDNISDSMAYERAQMKIVDTIANAGDKKTGE